MPIPQEPFLIKCDCFACQDNRTFDCEFLAWSVEKHEVNTLCTCLECEAQIELILNEKDYEYLQSELPTEHLNN